MKSYKGETRHNQAESNTLLPSVYKVAEQVQSMHRHSEAELLVVYDGTLEVKTPVRQAVLTKGKGLLINSGVPHSILCHDSVSAAGLLFSAEYIAAKGSEIHNKFIRSVTESSAFTAVPLSDSIIWQRKVMELGSSAMALLNRYLHDGSISGVAAEESCCFELELHCKLAELWRTAYSNLIGDVSSSGSENAPRRRVNLMIDFIRTNYHRQMSLEEIASAANISKSEASRCFQSCLGTSPVNYLLKYRINMASELLRSTSMTIEAISFECGFGSSSYFCKMFQRHTGTSPGKYRKKAE